MEFPDYLKDFSFQLTGGMAVLPGGLSAPTLTLVTTQSHPISNRESPLLVGCCTQAQAKFPQRQKKDLPRTKLFVRVSEEKTTEPSSALRFTVTKHRSSAMLLC